MDSDSWISARLSSSSRRYHSRSDLYLGGHDDADAAADDFRAEYLCPFAPKITTSFPSVATLTRATLSKPALGCVQFAGKRSLLILQSACCSMRNYVQRKRRVRKGGSSSTFSLLRKELREGALQSLLGGSSYIASSNSEPDPLLSSFIFNPVIADESVSAQPCPSNEVAQVKESSNDDFLER
ncbi:Protein dehydration-induced 19, C-terminal [Sesbania bispinosa]|nr:Protein dehydration-induced 19, C-terminal [Sesbania bispinosa]